MAETREVQVHAVLSAEIDPERVEEWVQANFTDGDQLQILDRETEEVLYDNIGSETL